MVEYLRRADGGRGATPRPNGVRGLPQLRRKELDVRRYCTGFDQRQSRHALGLRSAPQLGQRSDGGGHQQDLWRSDQYDLGREPEAEGPREGLSLQQRSDGSGHQQDLWRSDQYDRSREPEAEGPREGLSLQQRSDGGGHQQDLWRSDQYD